ncbi:methyltransferase domain-containing protein [Clostridium sp. 19966]|uniref:MerR family transcriptional regulator n=1 Tax=Clostridium sp. 19966 TaxID=2768166 RepID=UPI0028F062CE|nr:methyltransferase domain-containing protein [Clostridium sp. 19966]
MKNSLFTTGEFAEKAGVTIRTIRYYDKKDILKPHDYTQAGYRLYTQEDFARLQKILTLKYLGFSLNEIKEVLDNEKKFSLKQSMKVQKEIISNKMNHMKLVEKAINSAEIMVNSGDEVDWDKVIDVIKVINMERNILEQYRNSSNLIKRISLHDKFSTNKTGWFRWMLGKMKLKAGKNILELGCGIGTFWLTNIDYIPKGCNIVLTDISGGMIEDAKNNLGDNRSRFIFEVADANRLPYKDESFDVVIANHMLFYCSDRKKVLSEIKRVLKSGGYFYCSTVGKEHMKELDKLCKEYDDRIFLTEKDLAEEFGLENGKVQLEKYFFDINRYDYDDKLIVNESEPLLNYLFSTHGNIKEILKDNKTQFEEFVRNKLNECGRMEITKSSGLFESRRSNDGLEK